MVMKMCEKCHWPWQSIGKLTQKLQCSYTFLQRIFMINVCMKYNDLKNITIVQYRFNDDASHSIGVLSAWSVPYVGHVL